MDEQEIIESLGNQVAANAKEDYLDALGSLASRCESPIERVLIAALVAAPIEGISFSASARPNSAEVAMMGSSSSVEWGGEFYSQIGIGAYRADIFLKVFDRKTKDNWLNLVIECDGHDFHERTKEQAARDKRRDRWFQSRGFLVLRFAGSEIWKDPTACVDEVGEVFFAAVRCRRGLSA